MPFQLTNDPMIRKGLRSFLPPYYPNHLFYEEIGIWEKKETKLAIADVIATSPSSFVGIEIKSDRDSLTRLLRQIPIYEAVCTEMFLAVGERHLAKATNILPWYWGILMVYDGGDKMMTEVVREPSGNPNFHIESLVALLWHDELKYLLRKNQLYKGMSRARKAECAELLCLHLDEATLLQEIHGLLQDRPSEFNRLDWHIS